ncbi:hypothetical protein ACP4OV_002780 [Aristida adscensionis]
MVMMGMLLGGNVPFQKVYLHPIIRDAHGRKMSKSLGNVLDPVDIINGITLEDLQKKLENGNLDPRVRNGKRRTEKGFPLWHSRVWYCSQSDKINLDIKRVHGYRQWCNKLWNGIRFAMNKLGDKYTPPATIAMCSLPPVCKWILSVLNKAIGRTVSSLEANRFSEATSSIYSWWQYQLCDVFIEAIKPYFSESQEFEFARGASRDTLWVCLDTGLRLLHPFMPFITEELWQRLPRPKGACTKVSIMTSEYPSVVQEWANDQNENEMDIVLNIVTNLRSLQSTTYMHERRPAFVLCRSPEIAATVQCYQSQIITLASVSILKILTDDDATPSDCTTNIVNKDLSVYLQLHGALNTEAEREKLRRMKGDIQRQHDSLSQKMNALGYREKAPQSKQDEDMRKLAALLGELEIIDEAESKLEAAMDEMMKCERLSGTPLPESAAQNALNSGMGSRTYA